MNTCHICGTNSETQTEKCKLCCDGVEHEFCQACASDFQTVRTKFGTLEAGAAFSSLQFRRAALIAELSGAPKGIQKDTNCGMTGDDDPGAISGGFAP